MNLIDYNKAVDALEKERQLLLNREQYGAEDIIVHHALNVIADLPIIRQPEIVRCKDCKYWVENHEWIFPHGGSVIAPRCKNLCTKTTDDWFCADGKKEIKT